MNQCPFSFFSFSPRVSSEHFEQSDSYKLRVVYSILEPYQNIKQLEDVKEGLEVRIRFGQSLYGNVSALEMKCECSVEQTWSVTVRFGAVLLALAHQLTTC